MLSEHGFVAEIRGYGIYRGPAHHGSSVTEGREGGVLVYKKVSNIYWAKNHSPQDKVVVYKGFLAFLYIFFFFGGGVNFC